MEVEGVVNEFGASAENVVSISDSVNVKRGEEGGGRGSRKGESSECITGRGEDGGTRAKDNDVGREDSPTSCAQQSDKFGVLGLFSSQCVSVV